MKKQFFAAALILALGAGFTACSNDDLGKSEGKEVAQISLFLLLLLLVQKLTLLVTNTALGMVRTKSSL